MAYIYLEELEKILPGILSDWIDGDDEGWEGIFQEIERKCHVGKRLKGKKWQKKMMEDIDKLYARSNVDNADIGMLAVEVKRLDAAVTALRDDHKSLHSTVCGLRGDITAAKSMAETAKQRTEIDYTKCSQTDKKFDQPINVASKCGSCKHLFKQPIDQPCIGCCYNGMNISGMDKWEAKENE